MAAVIKNKRLKKKRKKTCINMKKKTTKFNYIRCLIRKKENSHHFYSYTKLLMWCFLNNLLNLQEFKITYKYYFGIRFPDDSQMMVTIEQILTQHPPSLFK